MTETEREFLSLIIGHRVRMLRKSKRLSQDALSSGIGSQSMISLIEGGRQLPPADVLHAVAIRLNDQVLVSYAQSLESDTLTDFIVSTHNQEDLMSILTSHRGKWHPAHERIASQLCQHHYYTRNFRQVEELCRLIILHVHREPLRTEALFYLGSSLLQQNRFEEAEPWLRQADKLSESLNEQFKGRLYYNLGFAYTYFDIQVLALWYTSQAVEIFHRNIDFHNQGKALALLGVIQTRLRMLEEAEQSLITANDILGKWGFNKTDQSRILVSLADVNILLGRNDEALKNTTLAIDKMAENDFLCQADAYRLMGHLAITEDKVEAALEYITMGITAGTLANDPHILTQLYLLQIQVVNGLSEKIDIAKQAFELTNGTNHHILHALSAETLASLLDSDPLKYKDARKYMSAALNSYRTYVHKNSMFTNLIDNLPIYDSYSAEEVPDGRDDGTSGKIPFAGSVKSM